MPDTMKVSKVLILVVMSLFMIATTSCDKDEEKDESKCGPIYYNDITGYASFFLFDWFHDSQGLSRFSATYKFVDICIDKKFAFDVTLQLLNLGIVYVDDVAIKILIPNSTTGDYGLTYYPQSEHWEGSYEVNLKQGFSESPGNFTLIVYVFIKGENEAETKTYFNESVDFVAVGYEYYLAP